MDDDEIMIEAKKDNKDIKDKDKEKKYIKLSQIEHILHRPDMYIGSITQTKEYCYVVEHNDDDVMSTAEPAELTEVPPKKRRRVSVDTSHLTIKMVKREITYIPGLLKLYDEILNNAADHRLSGCTTIKIWVTGTSIKIRNNGSGIPTGISEKHACRIPQLIFFNLLSGSNFDDSEKRVTGGRNGLGGKLANIFSIKFRVATLCSGILYEQEGTNNMSLVKEPKIKEVKQKTDWTEIEFWPDFHKFGLTHIDSDFINLTKRRAFDVAAIFGLSVTFNDEPVPVKNIKQYASLFLAATPLFFHTDRWDVAIYVREAEQEFEAVSYVNGIVTSGGGTHVQHVKTQILAALSSATALSSYKLAPILFMMVSAIIENPTFTGQAKDTLTTPVSEFGSRCDFEPSFLKKVVVAAKPFMDLIVKRQESSKFQSLSSKSGKRGGIVVDKLTDAAFACKAGCSCSLIITEGDSAKALALAGVSALEPSQRALYGIYPIRGKLPNTRELSAAKFADNNELTSIVKIIGLEFGRVYTDTRSLRYSRLVIMADQDVDGSHIKGLIINFIHTYWPSLLQLVPSFIYQFITPLVKITRGSKIMSFYTAPEFKAAVKDGDRVKYYKGLGTNVASEGREYFLALKKHLISFTSSDWACDDAAIKLAFDGSKADDRKTWLLTPCLPVSYSSNVTYTEFVNRELHVFSSASVVRAIPDIFDGFKPSLRKILFGCFKRNLIEDIKVTQLAGFVAEHTAYHHGDTSLMKTIIGMAQDYVGSNNVNLLVPSGQFGTRLLAGEDSAAPRYIYTHLSKVTRYIFKKEDDAILESQEDDGQTIEPVRFAPIVPYILFNGAAGIGTGWSCDVLPYNPLEIIERVKQHLNSEQVTTALLPWFAGFKGTVEQGTPEYVTISGKFEVNGSNTIVITEIPPHANVEKYKAFLQSRDFVNNVTEAHTDKTLLFTVTVHEMPEGEDLEKLLNLKQKYSTRNMHLIRNGCVKKYEGPDEIIQDFMSWRLPLYGARKQYLIKNKMEELEQLSLKSRFIRDILSDKIRIFGDPHRDMDAEYTKNVQDALLGMPIKSLTKEMVEKLEGMISTAERHLSELTSKTLRQMWIEDLDELESVLLLLRD